MNASELPTVQNPILWPMLRAMAVQQAVGAYAPYSRLHVGAAGLGDTGLVIGANVENASYGLTQCAECSLVADLIRMGGRRLLAVAVVAGDGQPLTPCGRCRQVLYEFGGPGLLLDAGEGSEPLLLGDLLPGAFGPDDIAGRAEVAS